MKVLDKMARENRSRNMVMARMLFTLLVSLALANGSTQAQAAAAGVAEPRLPRSPVSTFSIVAGDPATGELGIAVASRFFAVGSVVPWAQADMGAIATQSFANTSFAAGEASSCWDKASPPKRLPEC